MTKEDINYITTFIDNTNRERRVNAQTFIYVLKLIGINERPGINCSSCAEKNKLLFQKVVDFVNNFNEINSDDDEKKQATYTAIGVQEKKECKTCSNKRGRKSKSN